MEKKTVVLGVTSSVAVFKAVQLTSDLVKKGYDVEVIMSEHATKFVAPLSFESLTKHRVISDMFDRHFEYDIKHISLAKKADIFVIVPATANVIAKVAHGISDDMLTTTFLAATCSKIIAPAMNTNMYNNVITQKNLALCASYGMKIVNPDEGLLACGDIGTGKLASIDQIIDAIDDILYPNKILQNKKVLISAGPTIEAIDPVRFISNHSTGKMGYAIAKIARYMGAEVTLVSGPTSLTPPLEVEVISVQSAQDMYDVMLPRAKDYDFIIKAAAVGDYKTNEYHSEKMKRNGNLTLTLSENPDILKAIGEQLSNQQVLCGFAMETSNLKEYASIKMKKKHCDLMVANNLTTPQAGFGTNTNVVTMIEEDHVEEFDVMSKEEVARILLEKMQNIHVRKIKR